jgi:chromosome segregation protein
MHLESLEILGFKSFAKKADLNFPNGATCIVGPNGCGKSNITDAMRWILGEQSLKNLRAGKNEDLIFSSGNKRLSLAQASFTVRDDKNEAVKITRRCFRNGENEYLINDKKVKREDLLLYLAQINFGQKSYSIVSQGMVDWILYSSKQERKNFFDEATGISEYQIKKNKAISKIKKSLKNLDQAEIAIKEVEPRMRFLSRQIKKWERRQEVERNLTELETKHYGAKIFKFKKEKNEIENKMAEKNAVLTKEEQELKVFQDEFGNLASYQPSEEFKKLQEEWQKLLSERNRLLKEQAEKISSSYQIEKEIEEEEKDLAELEKPLEKLIHQQEDLLASISKIKSVEELRNIKVLAEDILKVAKEMMAYFVEPKVQEKKEQLPDKKDDAINKLIADLGEKIKVLEGKLNNFFELENQKRKEMMEIQKKLQDKQNKVSAASYELKEVEIQKVRVEAHEEDLKSEIGQETSIKDLSSLPEVELSADEDNNIFTEIQKLKREIDLIGGFDESFHKEYQECKEKYDFLTTQIEDLKKSIASLEDVKKKLEDQIKKEFFANFNKINKYFEEYFKFLFKGGSAKLVLEEEGTISQEIETEKEEKMGEQDNQVETKKEEIEETEENDQEMKYGVEIYARPPQKKNKTVQSLSGGEKALTSIALICAILKTKNPPFVVLDEVDAALDEANSVRLAEITKELAKNIQCIIVTHNPVSMEIASALYGVTIDKEGSSHLVSMKLEDI